MPRLLSLVALALVLAGCGRSAASPPATASPEQTVPAGALLTATAPATAATRATATVAPQVSPAPKETNTPLPAPAPATTPGTALAVAGTGKSGLRLREQPNGKVLQVLPEGTRLQSQGEQQQAAGYTWIHVRTADGKDGWVAAPFVAAAPPATPTPGAQ